MYWRNIKHSVADLELYEVKINKSETKIMVCGRKELTRIGINDRGPIIEEVKEFSYLIAKLQKMEMYQGNKIQDPLSQNAM